MSRRRKFATNLAVGAQEGIQPSKISRGAGMSPAGINGPPKRPTRRPVYRRLAK